MSADRVPVVDYREYTAGDAASRRRFARVLGEALEAFGFVCVEGHGVDPSLLAEAYALAERTFALPSDVKRRYETPDDGRQRGYTSFGVEHARDREVADLKEFWHVGRVLPAGHPYALSGEIPPNRFPAEVPAFEPTFLALFAALERFAVGLLDAVGDHLGAREGLFRDVVRDGNSVLRVIHYPDVPGWVPGAVRAAQHEDIDLLTVLPASTRPGLELLTRDGRWLPVEAPPGVLVCDTGDMMQLLTGGRLPATTHRVVNPPDADGGRLSMPFFLHPHPDVVLAPVGAEAQGISARDFLKRRLHEIGVM